MEVYVHIYIHLSSIYEFDIDDQTYLTLEMLNSQGKNVNIVPFDMEPLTV